MGETDVRGQTHTFTIYRGRRAAVPVAQIVRDAREAAPQRRAKARRGLLVVHLVVHVPRVQARARGRHAPGSSFKHVGPTRRRRRVVIRLHAAVSAIVPGPLGHRSRATGRCTRRAAGWRTSGGTAPSVLPVRPLLSVVPVLPVLPLLSIAPIVLILPLPPVLRYGRPYAPRKPGERGNRWRVRRRIGAALGPAVERARTCAARRGGGEVREGPLGAYAAGLAREGRRGVCGGRGAFARGAARARGVVLAAVDRRAAARIRREAGVGAAGNRHERKIC